MGSILLLLSLTEYFATHFEYGPLNIQSRLLSCYINMDNCKLVSAIFHCSLVSFRLRLTP